VFDFSFFPICAAIGRVVTPLRESLSRFWICDETFGLLLVRRTPSPPLRLSCDLRLVHSTDTAVARLPCPPQRLVIPSRFPARRFFSFRYRHPPPQEYGSIGVNSRRGLVFSSLPRPRPFLGLSTPLLSWTRGFVPSGRSRHSFGMGYTYFSFPVVGFAPPLCRVVTPVSR